MELNIFLRMKAFKGNEEIFFIIVCSYIWGLGWSTVYLHAA